MKHDPKKPVLRPALAYLLALTVVGVLYLSAEARSSAKTFYSQLHAAALRGDASDTARLLAAGANANAKDLTDDTPLHAAVCSGDLATTQMLLDAGADVNAPNTLRRGPVFYAVLFGHTELIDLLVSRGATLNQPDSSGWTPLHYASCFRDAAVLRRLIDWGADVNARDPRRGSTPLHDVARWGIPASAEILLEAGADPACRNWQGRTPLEEAKERPAMYTVLAAGIASR